MSKNKGLLNATELKSLLTYVINNNIYLQENNKTPITVEIEGISGIGKTSIVEQLALELNYDFRKVNISQFDELGDLIGIPSKQFQVAKNIGTDDKPKWSAKWIDERLLLDARNSDYKPTGKHRTAYSLPEWVPTKENTILFFDDWTRGQQRFIQALMEILNTQTYVSWKIPNNCTILLSANPDNGDYHVQSQDSAQKTRYLSVSLKFDINCWAEWSEKNNIDSRCINFLLMNPELVTENTNARAITMFFNSISSITDFNNELDIIQLLGENSVGPEFTSLFITFIHNKLDKLISAKQMMDDEFNTIKSKLIELIGDHRDTSNYRADIAFVLSTRLINYLIYNYKKPVTEKLIERIKNISSDSIFPIDIGYNIIRSIYSKNRTKYQKLLLDSDIANIVTN